jgi:hypothetical protein
MGQRGVEETRWPGGWWRVASQEGADKLEEGEGDEQGREKEGQETPERRTWVSRRGARSVAFVRGGLTTAAPQRHGRNENETQITKTAKQIVK